MVTKKWKKSYKKQTGKSFKNLLIEEFKTSFFNVTFLVRIVLVLSRTFSLWNKATVFM